MQRVWRRLTPWAAIAAGILSHPAGGHWNASFTTSVGRRLDPDYPRPSFSIEPAFAYQPSETFSLRARTLLDRPFDGHQRLLVPFLEVLAVWLPKQSDVAELGAFALTSGQDLELWGNEGPTVRQVVGAIGRWHPRRWVLVELSVGPYLGFSHYAARRNGSANSITGFLEQLSLTFQSGRWKLEFIGLVVQDWNGKWRNLYSTFERLSFTLSPAFSVGLTHQLLRSRVEDSGALMPIGFIDGRRSRIGGFVQWVL